MTETSDTDELSEVPVETVRLSNRVTMELPVFQRVLFDLRELVRARNPFTLLHLVQLCRNPGHKLSPEASRRLVSLGLIGKVRSGKNSGKFTVRKEVKDVLKSSDRKDSAWMRVLCIVL